MKHRSNTSRVHFINRLPVFQIQDPVIVSILLGYDFVIAVENALYISAANCWRNVTREMLGRCFLEFGKVSNFYIIMSYHLALSAHKPLPNCLSFSFLSVVK